MGFVLERIDQHFAIFKLVPQQHLSQRATAPEVSGTLLQFWVVVKHDLRLFWYRGFDERDIPLRPLQRGNQCFSAHQPLCLKHWIADCSTRHSLLVTPQSSLTQNSPLAWCHPPVGEIPGKESSAHRGKSPNTHGN